MLAKRIDSFSQGADPSNVQEAATVPAGAGGGGGFCLGRRLAAWLPRQPHTRALQAPAKSDADPREQHDAELLGRVAVGDATAFERLYDRFATPLFALTMRILSSKVEAEDVLQESFTTVWRRAADFNPDLGSPFNWVATIVRRRAIDALRSKCRHLDRLQTSFESRSDDEVASAADQAAETTEQRQGVRAALCRLAVPERQVIELAFFDGLTHEEIARGMEVPLGTVKARIRRGMLKLRPALAHLS